MAGWEKSPGSPRSQHACVVCRKIIAWVLLKRIFRALDAIQHSSAYSATWRDCWQVSRRLLGGVSLVEVSDGCL